MSSTIETTTGSWRAFLALAGAYLAAVRSVYYLSDFTTAAPVVGGRMIVEIVLDPTNLPSASSSVVMTGITLGYVAFPVAVLTGRLVGAISPFSLPAETHMWQFVR